MSEYSGSKLSTAEFAARKGIEVAAAVVSALAVYGTMYVTTVHGEKIASVTKNRFNKIKTRFKK